MIVIENSMKGEMIRPSHAQEVSPGVMDLLKKVRHPIATLMMS